MMMARPATPATPAAGNVCHALTFSATHLEHHFTHRVDEGDVAHGVGDPGGGLVAVHGRLRGGKGQKASLMVGQGGIRYGSYRHVCGAACGRCCCNRRDAALRLSPAVAGCPAHGLQDISTRCRSRPPTILAVVLAGFRISGSIATMLFCSVAVEKTKPGCGLGPAWAPHATDLEGLEVQAAWLLAGMLGRTGTPRGSADCTRPVLAMPTLCCAAVSAVVSIAGPKFERMPMCSDGLLVCRLKVCLRLSCVGDCAGFALAVESVSKRLKCGRHLSAFCLRPLPQPGCQEPSTAAQHHLPGLFCGLCFLEYMMCVGNPAHQTSDGPSCLGYARHISSLTGSCHAQTTCCTESAALMQAPAADTQCAQCAHHMRAGQAHDRHEPWPCAGREHYMEPGAAAVTSSRRATGGREGQGVQSSAEGHARMPSSQGTTDTSGVAPHERPDQLSFQSWAAASWCINLGVTIKASGSC